jgi:hypothetical protein
MNHKSIIFLTLIILLLSTCGAKYDGDNSTVKDWKTNLALWHTYRNKLIYKTTESTSAEGEKRLLVSNKKILISIFERLALDGVPSMDKERNNILKMIEETAVGNKVDMSGKLATDISNFWDKVLKYAEKHGANPEK